MHFIRNVEEMPQSEELNCTKIDPVNPKNHKQLRTFLRTPLYVFEACISAFHENKTEKFSLYKAVATLAIFYSHWQLNILKTVLRQTSKRVGNSGGNS